MPTDGEEAAPGGDVIQIEETIVVSRPRDEVFSVAADPANMPLWNPAVRESTLVGRLRRGAKVVQLVEILGRRFQTEFEVTTYEPGRRVAYASTGGPLRVQGAMEFRADRGRTHVRWIVSGEPRGFMRVAESVLLGMGRPEMRTCLENLKSVVEDGITRPHRPNSTLPVALARNPLRLLAGVGSPASQR